MGISRVFPSCSQTLGLDLMSGRAPLNRIHLEENGALPGPNFEFWQEKFVWRQRGTGSLAHGIMADQPADHSQKLSLHHLKLKENQLSNQHGVVKGKTEEPLYIHDFSLFQNLPTWSYLKIVSKPWFTRRFCKTEQLPSAVRPCKNSFTSMRKP